MKNQLEKLIDLKSIVTLLMTIALVVLLFYPQEPNKEVLALYCTSYGAITTLKISNLKLREKELR